MNWALFAVGGVDSGELDGKSCSSIASTEIGNTWWQITVGITIDRTNSLEKPIFILAASSDFHVRVR